MAMRKSLARLAQNIAKSTELEQDTRKTGINFLRTELATGLTFAETARQAEAGSKDRIRNRNNARKAYDTLVKLTAHYSGSEGMRIDREELEPQLTELRSALLELGEDVN